MFENIVWCHNEYNAPHHLKNTSFLNGLQDFEIPENVPTIIVLDDMMDSAYSTNMSQSFTKRSHHRNVSLLLITQNFFYCGQSTLNVSLSNKYIVVFKNPIGKTQIYFWTLRID